MLWSKYGCSLLPKKLAQTNFQPTARVSGPLLLAGGNLVALSIIDKGALLQMPEDITVGVRVLIISPSYVAGKVGVIYRRENLPSGQPSDRWLVQVDSEDLIVSLSPEEFQVLSSGEESL